MMHSTSSPAAPHRYPDIRTLRRAVPQDCFERKVGTSLYYVLRDTVSIASLAYLAVNYIPSSEQASIRHYLLWFVYAFSQGLVSTGAWILAHECGHGSLFNNQELNDVIGFILHSVLLVPYFSWKFTHSRHHRFVGHSSKDVAFSPVKKHSSPRYLQQIAEYREDYADVPAVQLVGLVGHQTLGWPLYLLLNISAGSQSYQRECAGLFSCLRLSHYDPWAAVFTKREACMVLMSDLGLCIMGIVLFSACRVLGTVTVLLLYGAPYLWVNHWIGQSLPKYL